VTVTVVIPWRAGCSHRQLALDYVTGWWAANHPGWPVVVGEWPASAGPWRKGCAVRAAGIIPAPDDVVVVADADVIAPGIGRAVDAIGWGNPPARWAVPCRGVYRLTESGTWLVVNGGIDLGRPLPSGATGVVQESYVGTPAGGIVAMLGATFDQVPLDPRFAGYGHEDKSWSLALHRLAGAPVRLGDPLWHLWHPPQPRLRRGPTTSRGIGSIASMRLWQRYREATTLDTMRSLVGEACGAYAQLMGGDHGSDGAGRD
jgi:hypothetical protein